MSKQGILLTVADDQEGANPQIITPDRPLPVIETEHERIHNGEGFQLSDAFSLAADAILYFLINPNGGIHWRDYRFIADDAPIDIELFENPTVTDNGTPLVPINRNRYSANTSSANIYSGATVTDDGDRLHITRIVGTGTGANTTGEIEGLPVEWILGGGNTYVLKVTNNGATAAMLYQFFWYER